MLPLPNSGGTLTAGATEGSRSGNWTVFLPRCHSVGLLSAWVGLQLTRGQPATCLASTSSLVMEICVGPIHYYLISLQNPGKVFVNILISKKRNQKLREVKWLMQNCTAS